MLISPAFAQTAGASPDTLTSFLPLLIMFAVLYFLMIRPQMKRAKEHRQLIESLEKGAEVITGSGLVGKVIQLDTSYVTLDIGLPGKPVEVVVQRGAVTTLLPKDTIKTLSK